MTTPHDRPTPQRIAETLPSVITIEQAVLALVGLGVPAEIAAFVTDTRITPTDVEVSISSAIGGDRIGTVQLSIMLDHRPGVSWEALGLVPPSVQS